MTVYIYIALSRNSLEIKGNSLALVLLCYFKIFSVPRVFVFNVYKPAPLMPEFFYQSRPDETANYRLYKFFLA